MWTIFQRPADFPTAEFVVREFYIRRGRDPEPAGEVVLCQTLGDARANVPPDAVCINRSPEDHPTIVESWL